MSFLFVVVTQIHLLWGSVEKEALGRWVWLEVFRLSTIPNMQTGEQVRFISLTLQNSRSQAPERKGNMSKQTSGDRVREHRTKTLKERPAQKTKANFQQTRRSLAIIRSIVLLAHLKWDLCDGQVGGICLFLQWQEYQQSTSWNYNPH